MDRDAIADAMKRFRRRLSVDVHFDDGDEAAAEALRDKLRDLGLEAELYAARHPRDRITRPPSWLIRYTVGGLLGLTTLLVVSLLGWPTSQTSRLLIIAFPVFLMSILVSYAIYCRLVLSDEARQHRDASERRLTLWLMVPVILLMFVMQAPWLGLLLLAIAIGGVGCAFIIRLMNHRQ
jgi:hypothetical protein